MAKKRSKRATPILRAVTAERAHRLSRMLQLLDKGSQTRATLIRHLRLDVRGFYRDLEVLRQAGVAIELRKGKYHLRDTIAAARERLPFPDPLLTVGEVVQLARGRSAAHKRLQRLLKERLG